MKHLLSIFMYLITLDVHPLNAQCQLIKSGFSEVFVDEFNSLSYSLERWDFKNGEWCTGADGCDDPNTPNIPETCNGNYFSPNQVEISGGILHLKSNKISPGMSTNCGVKDFLSSQIDSKVSYPSGAMTPEKRNKYTLFEARVLFPQGSTGIYPAFWMFGGGGQEIDIFEYHETHFTPAFFDGPTWPVACHREFQVDPDFNSKWHTYAVAWRVREDNSQMYKTTFFLDGKELYTQDMYQSNPGMGYHIILSNFHYNWATMTNDFNEMLVDYVRVYESSHENVEDFKTEYFNLLNNTNATCHPREYSMDVGEDNQVFFNNNGWMYNYYYHGGPNGQWHLGPLASWSQSEVINGDVKVGPGNIVYFRGQDAKLHKYEWIQPGSWQHSIIPLIENQSISHKEGSIAVGFGNGSPKLACAVNEGFGVISIYIFENGSWSQVNSSTTLPGGNFNGDLTIVGKYLFYRGANNKLYYCYKNGSIWNSAIVVDQYAQNIFVRNQGGSIVSSRSDAAQCFIVDANGWVRTIYSTGLNMWGYGFCTTTFAQVESVSNGSNLITINDNERRLYYKNPAGDLRYYHFTGSGINGWTPGVIDPCDNVSIAPISNNIRTGVRNQIFYRDLNGYIKNVFWRCCESLNDCGARSPIFRADDEKQSGIQVVSNSADNRFSIHPNPISNFFYISDKDKENLNISIYDSQGKFVYINEMYSDGTSISIKDYPNGLYFVKIFSGQTSAVIKIVKLH